MYKILLLNMLLVLLTLLMIFGYFYQLLTQRIETKKLSMDKLAEDKLLYNLDYVKGKLFLANILNDDSILCTNDNINNEDMFKKKFNLHNNINYNKNDNNFKYIKEDEQKLIKKISMLN